MKVSVSASWKAIARFACRASMVAAWLLVLVLQSQMAMANSIPADTEADVECLIVGARLSASPSPEVKLSGGMLMVYFLGRIDGRTPDAKLEGLIAKKIGAMTAADLEEASRRCRTEFSKRGTELTEIGGALARGSK